GVIISGDDVGEDDDMFGAGDDEDVFGAGDDGDVFGAGDEDGVFGCVVCHTPRRDLDGIRVRRRDVIEYLKYKA
ncbi:hypothetical protein Tco_1421329, partial [Tanacetum coccineum]